MPSQRHEVILLLLRNRPELAAILLRDALQVELPKYTEVRVEAADFTQVDPTEYRADLALLLHRGRPVLGIIAEAQLRRDAQKRYSWPVYLTTFRAKHKCPCCVLVLAPSASVARWAARPIELGPGNTLVPLVIGPGGVPVVRDPGRARKAPELSVLSAIAHGRGDVETAASIAVAAAAGIADLDEETRALYSDIVESALSEAARKAFSMLPQDYKFQGPSYRKGIREGEIDALLTILKARELTPSKAQRQRIASCTDLDTLRTWLQRAATAANIDELFV